MTEISDKKVLKEFWGSIKGERKEPWKDAEWLENFQRDFEYKEEQEEVEIAPEKIKKILREMPNWKGLGPHFVQVKIKKRAKQQESIDLLHGFLWFGIIGRCNCGRNI